MPATPTPLNAGGVTRPLTPVVGLCITELFCLGSTFSATLVGLPLAIDRIATAWEPETVLSVALAAGAAAAIVSSPLFGWLSDRRAARTGSRGLWILGGAVVGALLMIATGVADSVAMLVLCWVGVQTAYATSLASLYGALSDLVPVEQRGRSASWFAAAATGSMILGAGTASLLPKEPVIVFTLLPVLTVAVAAALVARLRTAPRPTAAEPDLLPSDAVTGFWRLWRQRLIAQCGWGVATLFGVHVLVRRVGLETDQAASLTGLASALGALAAVLTAIFVSTPLARRVGYRWAISTGLVLILVANLWLALSTTATAFIVGCVIAGAGVGIFTSLDLALVLRVLRPGTTGRYLGLFSAARTLPQSLVPAAAPLLLALGSGDLVGTDRTQNYFAFYLVGAGLTVAALSLVRGLPVPVAAEAHSEHPSPPSGDPAPSPAR